MPFFRDIDWQVLRPARGWLLAKADPRAMKTAGGIHLPDGLTGLEKVSIEMATVLKVGVETGEILGYDIKPGERFCYRGFVKDVTWYMLEPAEDGSTVFLINHKDVLAVIAPGVEVGVYLEGSNAPPLELPAGATLWDPTVPIDVIKCNELGDQGKMVFVWDHDIGGLTGLVIRAHLGHGWIEQVLTDSQLEEEWRRVAEKYNHSLFIREENGSRIMKRFGRFTGYVTNL